MMRHLRKALLAFGFYGGIAAAEPERGQLLYATYCDGCHTEQVHWRAQKQVRDWESLVAEVRRWQRNMQPEWTADDVAAVARHLNGRYYRFPERDRSS